ncbi:MAG: Gfo/Idh/MocA family protein [Bacteroidota bacterium]
MKNSESRRHFLKQALALSAFSVTPGLLAGQTFTSGKPVSPSDRVNLACIGIGNRGGEIINALYNTGLCNIVALCDVDMGAPHTQAILGKFPDVPRFQDFRKMFDAMANQIDAVSVGTPDHSHFPITMMAMALGKHVYVEKPLARTFRENELLMQAARKYKVATQMGNQGHSDGNYFQFKAWVDAGIIKDVTAITAHMNSARRWHGWDTGISRFPQGQPVPDTLDWDLWLMAAEHHDFHKDFVNGQWRSWYHFGLGALGDWGAHIIDTAHEFLNLGLPYEISCLKAEGHNDFFFPQSSTILFRFPERGNMPPVDITWYDGVNNVPAVPEGYGVSELDPNIPPPSTGQIQPAKLNPGKIIYSKELTFKGGSHGSTLSIIPEDKAKEMASRLPEVPKSPSNHFANFLKACKGEEKCRSPFEISGPLSQVFSLGVLSQWLNTRLVFDRNTKQITNHKKANELLAGPPPRKGWEDFYKV